MPLAEGPAGRAAADKVRRNFRSHSRNPPSGGHRAEIQPIGARMKAVRIIAVVFAANLTACQGIDAGPESDRPDLNRYVAMGSSITMGFASGGLTADGQRASWPAQLASREGVDFTLPLIDGPGCPPPLAAPLGNLRRAD